MKCPKCNTEITDYAFEEYKLKLDERKMLIDCAREGSNTFDKAILTLTSGAFGLSFIFLKDIVQSPIKETLFMLSLSWIFFSISLIVILVSFLTSPNAHYFEIEQTFKEKEKDRKKNIWSKITWICNIFSIISLALAFSSMGYFFYTNVILKNY